MRGRKKLVLGMAVISTTGMLVFTGTFPQPQIMQTEGAFQVIENGAASIITESGLDKYTDTILAQAATVDKKDINAEDTSTSAGQKAAQKSKAKNNSSKKASKEKNKSDNKKADKKSGKTKQTSENNKKTDKKSVTNKDTNKDTNKGKKSEKNTESKSDVNVKNSSSDSKVPAAKKKTDKNSGVSQKKETAKTEEKWENKLMADVDDYLNIRTSDNKDSEVAGKLRKGDVATIVKEGNIWTKIKSGSVKGYVKNKFCVTGTKAYRLANKICGTFATVQADGLRIRKSANKNATILEAAEEGDQLMVNTKAKDKDGWVTVRYNDKNAFVSEKYVDVELATGKAISIEEELEQIAAKQREEEAARAASASQESSTVSASSGSVTTQSPAAPAISDSDLTLLSAIIYCEAGGESYAGQVAVGAVVMNRVRSSSYPNSISGVVYQSGQFSPVANGSLARALSNGLYRNCISAAQEALAGADNTGGAKFFHRVNGDAGLVIGNHVFY